jgi:hypothetical protein
MYNNKHVEIIEGQDGRLLVRFKDGSGQRWIHSEDLKPLVGQR